MTKSIFNDKDSYDWNTWNARSYLDGYFKELGPDAELTTKFVSRELAKFKNESIEKLLEFGAGPTIIGAIGAAPYAKEIHIADYLETNLEEIRLWLKNSPEAFNWDNTIEYILKLEGIKPTKNDISKRAYELRKKITKTLHCDAGLKKPIINSGQYPFIITLYCADSATDSKTVWEGYMRNIFNLLLPSGTILIAALRKCQFYNVGPNKFPSANIDESDLEKVLIKSGFFKKNIHIEVIETPDRESEGFTSLIFARAQKTS